jgi:hypothetical protein
MHGANQKQTALFLQMARQGGLAVPAEYDMSNMTSQQMQNILTAWKETQMRQQGMRQGLGQGQGLASGQGQMQYQGQGNGQAMHMGSGVIGVGQTQSLNQGGGNLMPINAGNVRGSGAVGYQT